jgi:hypothetical protein
MAGRLDSKHLGAALKEIFSTGVPAVSFLRLTYEEARRYEGIIDDMYEYVVDARGPSLEYDPMKRVPMYSVVVRKPIGGKS